MLHRRDHHLKVLLRPDHHLPVPARHLLALDGAQSRIDHREDSASPPRETCQLDAASGADDAAAHVWRSLFELGEGGQGCEQKRQKRLLRTAIGRHVHLRRHGRRANMLLLRDHYSALDLPLSSRCVASHAERQPGDGA